VGGGASSGKGVGGGAPRAQWRPGWSPPFPNFLRPGSREVRLCFEEGARLPLPSQPQRRQLLAIGCRRLPVTTGCARALALETKPKPDRPRTTEVLPESAEDACSRAKVLVLATGKRESITKWLDARTRPRTRSRTQVDVDGWRGGSHRFTSYQINALCLLRQSR
jgi:hypothetical protein